MKKYVLLLFCLTAASLSRAQEVEMIAQKEYATRNKMQRAFHFLEQETDTAGSQYIASFKASLGGKKNNIANSFAAIRKTANELGANCFRLRWVERDSVLHAFAVDVFLAGDAVLQSNTDKHLKNRVYVFGGECNNKETYSLKVNGEKTEFASGTYLSYQLGEDKGLRLSKGGIAGASAVLKYKADKPAAFFTISGFGLGGSGAPPQAGVVGVGFNTGRINSVDNELGFLLIRLLTPANQ